MRLHDIACPGCGSTAGVEKRGLGRYRCTDCGRSFTPADVR